MTMMIFFKKYIEEFLIAFAFLLLGILIGYFAWGIIDISQQINQGIFAAGSTITPSGFNLKDGASLNLKGLVQ